MNIPTKNNGEPHTLESIAEQGKDHAAYGWSPLFFESEVGNCPFRRAYREAYKKQWEVEARYREARANTETKHTPGALRAAEKWVEPRKGSLLDAASVKSLAELIDSETGVSEMLEALRQVALAYFPNADKAAAKSGEESLHPAVRLARAAIARAESKVAP